MSDYEFVTGFINDGVKLAIRGMIDFGVITEEDGKLWLEETRIGVQEDPTTKRLTLSLTFPKKYGAP